MVKIKICGITNKIDAINAVKLGVDMLGFIFYEKSKRYVDPKTAKDIINELPPYIAKVGVFVDEARNTALDIAGECGLDTLQFHGDETPDYCRSFRDDFKVIKAFRIKDKKSLGPVNGYDVDFFLLDTYSKEGKGGTGKHFDWKILQDFEFLKPIILSGGLTPENIGSAIKTVLPYGVDVSSGLESTPGRKDAELIKAFVANVRKAD